MRTLIKICGVTQPSQAEQLAQLDIDAVGLNFYPGSRRVVDVATAAPMAEVIGETALRIGVFQNPTAEDVSHVLGNVELDILQFHGEEPSDFCQQFGLPYIKVVPMQGPVDFAAVEESHPGALALLLDTALQGASGGTGQTFDWSLWPRNLKTRLVLAGGLNADNVAQAVHSLRPYAVDVASGVEGDTPGVKDFDKVNRFIHEVRNA